MSQPEFQELLEASPAARLRRRIANKVIVGLDHEDPEVALAKLRELAAVGVKWFKVGKALIDYGSLPEFFRVADKLGVYLFVDGKGHDVLNTLKLAVGNPRSDNPRVRKFFNHPSFWLYSVMIEGNSETLKGMVEHLRNAPVREPGEGHDGPFIIAVGHLTSLVQEGQKGKRHDLTEIGSRFTTMAEAQANLMGVAYRAGARYAICSGEELPALRAAEPDLNYLVTAIRLPGKPARGQGRPVTPEEAFRAGATAIIVAGDVMNAPNSVAAYWAHVDNACLAFPDAV